MTESTCPESAVPGGPHRSIAAETAQEQFLCELFDRLWDRYRSRVEHVAVYERVIGEAGAAFVNDHIAFRTFALQRPNLGIAAVSRPFEALGYRPAGCYFFPDKQLSAIHFQHSNEQLPKLFISELQVWQLEGDARRIVESSLTGHRPLPDDELLNRLAHLKTRDADWNRQMDQCVTWLHDLPWNAPAADDVNRLNQASQYGAWVLVHGYNVNHFTSLINSHGAAAVDDIDKTVAALRAAGVPMKDKVEGAAGSKLRQTATAAAVIDIPVRQQGQSTTMPWTYAYFELAERGEVTDAETGRTARFEGFLGPQATHLFEMTKRD